MNNFKIRNYTGCILIILSIIGMIFWESCGRQMMYETQILVLSHDMEKGSTVSRESFVIKDVDVSFPAEGCLAPSELDTVLGKVFTVPVKAGQQVLGAWLEDPDEDPFDPGSVFVIPQEWIDSVPAEINKGNEVELYLPDTETSLGQYTVYSVSGKTDRYGNAYGERRIGIEIRCRLSEYERIRKSMSEENSGLIIIPIGL